MQQRYAARENPRFIKIWLAWMALCRQKAMFFVRPVKIFFSSEVNAGTISGGK
jgi:hypothetical protein